MWDGVWDGEGLCERLNVFLRGFNKLRAVEDEESI